MGGKIRREKQFFINISYLVEVVVSGELFQSHLQRKSARAIFLLNSMFTEMWNYMLLEVIFCPFIPPLILCNFYYFFAILSVFLGTPFDQL